MPVFMLTLILTIGIMLIVAGMFELNRIRKKQDEIAGEMGHLTRIRKQDAERTAPDKFMHELLERTARIENRLQPLIQVLTPEAFHKTCKACGQPEKVVSYTDPPLIKAIREAAKVK